MKVYPNCKINIGLNIVERRPDGYHNLQTVFYPIPLCDELSVQADVEDSLVMEGIPIEGNPEKNLVMRVIRLLRDEGYNIPPLSVTLNKQIPSGAGLGGGSSDAAFMMKLLNKMFNLGLGTDKMEVLLSPLGADCPFFVRNRPVYAEGIGNIFTEIPFSLRGWYLVLIKPDDFVSTREAYSQVHPHFPEHAILTHLDNPVETWRGRIVNDFEQSIYPSHPGIQVIRDELYRLGAAYSAMSGSGSCVYGLFRTLPLIGYDQLFPGQFHFQCMI